MAIKLYPPNVEGTIPAFYGTVLTVPFSMNKAVSKRDVYGMQIKIKNVQNGAYILTDEASVENNHVLFDPYCQAVFDFSTHASKNRLKVGQHYKIQIAYIANDEDKTIGYFSTVAVVKYTTEPNVSIDGLKISEVNMHQYDYIGLYSNPEDSTERLYSYHFNLYDNDSNLIQTSGEKIHNAENDISLLEQIDIYNIEQDLEINKSYFLEYIITTVNNLQKSSGRYRIMQKKSVNPEIKADLIPELNFENGYVDVRLIGKTNDEGVEYAATGAFKILRASSEDNYQTWHEVLKFALYGQQPSRWMWKDFTVKQGVSYRYALQQYNEQGLTSNRLESDPIYVDFEHAFLYDGMRQLKIKYNPKITNFKNNLLETKLNTIGSQHPFIFRNGNIKYKEFAISGLLSCSMDEELLFADEEEVKQYDYTSNLTGENIASEREFKLKVLEWLNNGEPKLFRSPTEGNYIVRLVNVSLTPNDSVGRMLHTFNSTAYEIAEYSYKNLNELGLISVGDPTTDQLRWETIELSKSGIGNSKNLLTYKAVSLRFEGLIPGDKLRLVYETGNSTPKQKVDFEVTIGVTGSYIVDLESGITVLQAYFIDSPIDNENVGAGRVQHQGTLTYAYYSKVQNRFDSISNIQILDAPLVQYIGEYDIIDDIEDVKTDIQGFYWIHCMLRDRQEAYYGLIEGSGAYFKNIQCTELLEFDPYVLYHVTNTLIKDSEDPAKYSWLDGAHPDKKYSLDKYSSKIYFNGNEMDLEETLEFTVKNPKNINELVIGNGVMAEVAYQKQIIDYSVEFNNTPLVAYGIYVESDYNINLSDYQIDKTETTVSIVNLKNAVQLAYDSLYSVIYNPSEINSDLIIEQYRDRYNTIYNVYITILEILLKQKEEAQGDVV